MVKSRVAKPDSMLAPAKMAMAIKDDAGLELQSARH